MGLYLEAACELPVAERAAGKNFQRLAKHQRRHCNFTLGCLRLSKLTPSLRRLTFMVQGESHIHEYFSENGNPEAFKWAGSRLRGA
jgi:hypothetical protein